MLDLVFGDFTSKEYLPLLWKSQSNGDLALLALNGERMAEVAVALNGESIVEKAGDWGIRKRPRRAVEGADVGYVNGFGGAIVEVGDL